MEAPVSPLVLHFENPEQLRAKLRAIVMTMEPWVTPAHLRAVYDLGPSRLCEKLRRFRDKFGGEKAFPVRKRVGGVNIWKLQVTPELDRWLRIRGKGNRD